MPQPNYLSFDAFIEGADDEDYERWYANATEGQKKHADTIREIETEEPEELQQPTTPLERRRGFVEALRRFFFRRD